MDYYESAFGTLTTYLVLTDSEANTKGCDGEATNQGMQNDLQDREKSQRKEEVPMDTILRYMFLVMRKTKFAVVWEDY